MALQKQLVPLPLLRGVDTKVDIKQEEPGFLRKAENIVYETLKLFRKRNGYDSLSLDVLGSTDLTGTRKLTKYGNELVALKPGGLYSYSQGRMKWSLKGTLWPANTVSSVVQKNAANLSSADAIVVDQFKVFSWEEDGTVKYSVQDLDSQSFVVSNMTLASGERPVLANIQNDVYVIYGDSADLCYKSFSILEPATLSTATVVASDRHPTDGTIDCRSAGTAIAVAYNSDNTGDDLVIFKINQDGTPSSLIGVNSESASDALNVYVDTQNRIVVTFSDGTDFKVVIYAFNLNAAILAPTLIESIAVTSCTSIESSSGYKVYYEVDAASNYVKQANFSLAGSVTGVAVFCRSVGLAADIFKQDDTLYVPTVFESATQSSYFLLQETGALVTKWANQNASSLVQGGVLPSSTQFADSKVLVGSLFRNRTQTDSGNTFFSTNGVGSVIVDFAPASCYSNAELAGGLHICAGFLKFYDGNSVSEHGFCAFPEGLTNPSNSATGGSLSDGSRGYKAVYKWTDNTGRDHRSAPTLLPLEVTLSGGGSVQESDIRVPTLRVTEKTDVVIELYRTEDAGTTYYKVTSDLVPVLNDKSVDYIDITDGLSDTDLLSREALYTTGDVLENIQAPACFQITPYNGDRLALVGENAYRTFWSKQVTEEQPVEFSDAIYRDVEPTGGPLTAIRNMASKLLQFTEDSTYYVSGEGPLNTGVQDTFTKPETVAGDVGCTNPDSLSLVPDGMLFKSRKGIWKCAANLSMQYVGDRMEAYNGETVTAASIVGELNQVRFLLQDETALVYNYNLNMWGTFENHGGQSSVVIGDDYYYLRPDGSIYKENPETFSDNSSPIKMRFETGWLSPSELQGYARVYHALILGTFKSSHKLRVRVAYDFVDAYVQETIIDPTDFIDPTPYGSDEYYGATSPYGGAGNLYQVRVDFEQQKCQSMKILIEDLQSTTGEGLTISGITFRVGIKAGSNKLPVAQQTGTE